jgi:transcriptional regulator with XRE-family HTH domain
LTTVGKRLKRLRMQRGLTQRALAEPNYTHAYVSTIEAERRHPSAAALAHFATKLGVEVDELVTGRPPDLAARLELELQEARIALSAGRSAEADETFARIAREARRFLLPKLQARAEETRGLCAERLGEPERALEHYAIAERLLAGSPATSLAGCIAGRARCHGVLGDVRYAVHLLEDFVGALERDGLLEPTALLTAHACLAVAYLDAGLYRQAGASAQLALSLAAEVEDPEKLAVMHMSVARVLLEGRQAADAVESLGRASDLFSKIELHNEMAAARLARGRALGRSEDPESACDDLLRARSVYAETGAHADEARAVTELGRIAYLTGARAEAVDLLEEAVRLAAKDEIALALAKRELGISIGAEDPSESEGHLRAAIDLLERCDRDLEAAATYRALGDILTGRSDVDSACNAYRSGLALVEKQLH